MEIQQLIQLEKNMTPIPYDKTPQALVHICHILTEVQYKMWYLMLRHLKVQLESGAGLDEGGFSYMKIEDLTSAIGYEMVRKVLKENLSELRRSPIIFNYLEKDGSPVIHEIGFISEWRIFRGRIGFKVSDIIQNALMSEEGNKMFLLLNWDIFNSFSGKYTPIIYKLCKDYANFGKTPYFQIEKLKNYLGIEVNEYTDFRKFNQRILNKAIQEINISEKSEILVQAVFKRSGRKVLGLHFEIENRQATKQLPSRNKPVREFGDAFNGMKTEPNETHKQAAAHLTDDQIRYCIQEANQYMKSQEDKGLSFNSEKIYYCAFHENWGQRLAALEVAEKENQEKLKKEKEEKAKAEAEKKKAEEKEKQEKQRICNEECALLINFVNTLDEEQRNLLFETVRNKTLFLRFVFDQNYSIMGNDIVTHPALREAFLNQIPELFG